MAELLSRIRQAATARVQSVQLKMLPETLEGPGSLYDVPSLLRDNDVRCAMIVTTPGFVKRGALVQFQKDLLTKGVTTAVFSEVAPDPDFECVEKAAAFYRSHGCQAMIAIGGGSVMDCAKVAGALAVCPGKSTSDLVGTMRVRKSTPYLVAVPTTAGTGSEVTAAAVVTDSETHRKFAVSDLALIPDVAVLDPTLLKGLPQAMTAYTGMDALTHAVEAYINRFGSHAARSYAKQAVAIIFEHLKESYDDGANMRHREAMLTASYYAGIAFTNAMVGYVHALAHGIGGLYHVQHGLANAVLLPVVLREYGKAAEGRLADLGRAIGMDGSSDHELATKFIAAVQGLSDSMGIPRTIPEIQLDDIPELAIGAEREGNPAYPVPAIWHRSTFEKVLRAVSTLSDEQQEGIEGGSLRITEESALHDDRGQLTRYGWATSPLLEYSRKRARVSPLRVKEWDYYLVNDGAYALALTIGDMGYTALISASLLDFAKGTYVTQSAMSPMPLGRIGLPVSSGAGVSEYSDRRVSMSFEVADGLRRLAVKFENFKGADRLSAEIVLDKEPRDSMVIVTPWAEDDDAFFYNQKIVGMRAIGSFTLGEKRHWFDGVESFGLLDWGRGVWTYDNTWYWSAAQGVQSGHLFGFNLGYGFGDTSAASENMVFVDGVAHKLGRVDFGIPERNLQAKEIGKRYDLMRAWHFTDDGGRLDLVFTPEIDRADTIDFKLIVSDQHQVFGTFDGFVTLDDGSRFAIRGLRGFAEAVHNRY